MIDSAAGDVHRGATASTRDLLAFETSLGVRFDVVLQVGDLGVWPDRHSATRKHGGAGDCAA